MTEPRLTGWWLIQDSVWDERKQQMRKRTAENVELAKDKPAIPSAIDPLACDKFCLNCGGEGYTVIKGKAIECKYYRQRIEEKENQEQEKTDD